MSRRAVSKPRPLFAPVISVVVMPQGSGPAPGSTRSRIFLGLPVPGSPVDRNVRGSVAARERVRGEGRGGRGRRSWVASRALQTGRGRAAQRRGRGQVGRP